MPNLKEAFETAVNNISSNGIEILQDTEGYIPVEENDRPSLSIGKEEAETFDAEEYAKMMYTEDTEAASSMQFSEEVEGERALTFSVDDLDVPFWFDSYDELATTVLANVFESEKIKSVNSSFFGDVIRNTNPKGFSRTRFGNHEFIVRDKSDRIVYVFEFLAKAKESLLQYHRYECPLVKEINIFGSVAYTLVLTPKELMDLQRSYPTYSLNFVNSEKMSDLKLVIRAD